MTERAEPRTATASDVADPLASIEQSFIALVRRSLDPRANRYINSLAGCDLERAEVTLLTRIAQFGPIRMSTLADEVGLDLSTVSRQVARLVDADLVDRRIDPDDRRASLLELSEGGRELYERVRRARRDWLTTMLADFDPAEQAELANLLERFIDAMHRFDQNRP